MMCFLYILHAFFPNDSLMYVLSLIALCVFLFSILKVGRIPRIIGLILVIAGVFINFSQGKGVVENLEGLIKNLPLLTLILLVPLLAIPLKVSGYFASAHYYMTEWKHDSKKAFFGLSGLLALISPVLNMGSVRMVHEMANQLKFHPVILGKSYFIGFSTAMLWSPYYASIALVLFYVNAQVADYILVGLLFALVQLCVGNLLFRNWAKKQAIENPVEAEVPIGRSDSTHKKNILKLGSILMLLILSLLLLENVTGLSMILLVSLISLLFPPLWALVRRMWKEIYRESIQYTRSLSTNMNNEIVLFLSAGLFGTALTTTAFADWLQYFLVGVSQVSLYYFVFVVIFTVFILAFVGIHQIIVIPILAMQLSPEMIGTTPVVLALIFIMAWAISAVLSPLNAINLLVSNIVKQNGITVGFRWNGVYILSMIVVGTSIIYILELFK